MRQRRFPKTYHCAVLCKGGHQLNDANDLLILQMEHTAGLTENASTIRIPMVQDVRLSSAIASNLAKGL